MKNWKRQLLICVLLFAFIHVTVWAADWPRFLGPDGSGISLETGLNLD
jgi:hypothetical protein